MGSITDKPIESLNQDLLKVENYAKALKNFILSSDTPITIGLQGEWGTGKTSMMSMMKELLAEEHVAASWVNTWEYSMFRSAHETTPAVLKGMLEKLVEYCKERNQWDIGDEANQRVKKVGRFLTNIANQVVANQTGIDVKGAVDGEASTEVLAEIAAVKAEIGGIISKLIQSPGNEFKKVVFFVDDLDRIPPGDAVEVLEALKNIFDIQNCVFVLAIDYEVVVKGLESKFGPKTPENEREFRSFFDKIIQVPFSMPTGTYNIDNFLEQKFKELGVEVDPEDTEKFGKVVRFTIGSNPRSLKRYLNSFSLINQVRSIDGGESDDVADNLTLFSLLGIQISYPHLFRLLTQNANFVEWDSAFANKHSMNLEAIQEELKKFGENDLLDEVWEQVVWGHCQRDAYMKSRVFDILLLLNFLRDEYKEDLQTKIEDAMEFASITSVDDDLESRQATQKVGNKTYLADPNDKMSILTQEGANQQAINALGAAMNMLQEVANVKSNGELRLTPSAVSFYNTQKKSSESQLLYLNNPGKRSAGFGITFKKSNGGLRLLKDEILAAIGEDSEAAAYVQYKQKSPLFLGAKLADILGPDKYLEVLRIVINKLDI